MDIYNILESQTFIVWLSKMKVKHEYVKVQEIIPGVQEIITLEYVLNQYLEYWCTEPVPEVPVRTAVSQVSYKF
jgi:hypothetical protein